MRTTLGIDDDVLLAVKERARRENRSAGKIISELAREALTGRHLTVKTGADESFFGFDPLPHRGNTVTNALIDSLREQEPE